MQSTDRKKVLIVHAHPERTSVTHQLFQIAAEVLETQGHEVMQSDLYRMGWKAVFDERDFPKRVNGDRLSFIEESEHAFANGCQRPDVEEEQRKILAADAVVLCFPLWWYSMPAIDYGPRGINGPLEQLLFPITLFFPGMQVLPTFAAYGAAGIDAEGMTRVAADWRVRVEGLFKDEPIAFRPQNGGDYPDRHMLAGCVAPNQTGLMVHIADGHH